MTTNKADYSDRGIGHRDPIGALVAYLRGGSGICTLGGSCRGTGRSSWGWLCGCRASDLLVDLERQYRKAGDEDPERCCEEHFPSFAMTFAEQAEHVCPACGWGPDSGRRPSDG